MKASTRWKIAGSMAVMAVVVAAATVELLYHGRAQPLGLAHTGLRAPATSPTPDDPLTLACRPPAVPNNAASGVAGLWVIQPGSLAGYRAHEKFAKLTSPHEAVARTDRMSGWILVTTAGGTIRVETACIAVDVRTLSSVDELPGFNTGDRDKSARDFLSATSHPFVVFQPYPATLDVDPASTGVQHVRIRGDLQVSGVTRSTEFGLDVQLRQSQLAVAGSTTVAVGDFGVQVPQEVGGFVQVDPRITLEVSVILLKPL